MLLFRRLSVLVLGACLIGCDDAATGPGKLDRLAASTFEAIGRSRIGSGDGFGATAAYHASLALRAGIRPTRVSISVDGTTEQYWALEVEHAFANDVAESPSLPEPSVMRSMIAWRGPRAERVIAVTIAGDTGTFALVPNPLSDLPAEQSFLFMLAIGTMFERGGPPFFSVDGGARSTLQLIGAACQLPRPPVMSQLIAPPIGPRACNRATFFTRFNMRAEEGPIPGAVASRTRVVRMDGHDIAGIRLEYAPLPTFCPLCG